MRPYPKAGEKKQKSKRRTGGSKIYTDTPEKDKLEEIEMEKLLKEQKRISRNLFGKKTNTGKPLTKKFKAKEPSSSSEDSVAISVHGNSDDDFSDEYEDLSEITGTPKSNKDDFVLVRFKVKNAMVHFVGQILELNHLTSKIKFLRRKGLSNTFYFPAVDDISVAANDDIISKLTPATKTGTARTSSYFQFYYNFNTLIVN